MTLNEETLSALKIAVTAANEKLATDVVAIDVSSRLPIADVFLICTGRNERQVGAIAEEIEKDLSEAGIRARRREGQNLARWILLDFGDVIVHIFHEEDRQYYALERLWDDCPVVVV
ncbi:MAG: ribosome silencing factor [Microbacteriaceae bacterium]|nr:ribosome silencing factor [Microbacteriaceae bacterium]